LIKKAEENRHVLKPHNPQPHRLKDRSTPRRDWKQRSLRSCGEFDRRRFGFRRSSSFLQLNIFVQKTRPDGLAFLFSRNYGSYRVDSMPELGLA
jgi:hypothetical protein